MAEAPRNLFGTDAARVRSVLGRELETISTYEALAAEADAETVKQFFLHLASEEKEHVAEAVHVLGMLDPGQQQRFVSEIAAGHFAAAPAPAPVPQPPASVAAGKGSTCSPRTAAPGQTERSEAESKSPAVPVEVVFHVPEDPRRVAYAVPFPAHPPAGQLTVGSLRRRS